MIHNRGLLNSCTNDGSHSQETISTLKSPIPRPMTAHQLTPPDNKVSYSKEARFVQRLPAHQLHRVTAAALIVHREALRQGFQKVPLGPQNGLKAGSPLRDGNPAITSL